MRQLLSDGIEDYLRFRKSQDYTDNTLVNERVVLRKLLATTGNIYIDNLDARHMTRYFEEASKTRRPSTLNGDHVNLNQFFRWARHTKRMGIDNDPLFGRRKPIPMARERDRIHVSRFPHLLDVSGAKDPRNRAIVACLLYTLVREQEASDIRVGDLDLNAGTVRVVVTKSRLEDRLPVSTELDAEMRAWLTCYTTECGPLQPHWYLFPQRRRSLTPGV